MKKLLLTAAFAAPFMLNSQTIASEDFESYTNGDLLTDVGGANGWREWGADFGTASGGYSALASSDYASSGMMSGRSVSNTTVDSDALWTWTDVTTGQYSVNMNVLVPVGSAGGYIGIGDSQMDILATYASMYYILLGDSVLLGSDGTDYIVQAPLIVGDWNSIHLMVDLDAGTSEVMLNGVSVGTGTTGDLATNGLGGLDLWGTGIDVTVNPAEYNPGDYYYDDIKVVDMSTTGINEEEKMSFSVNPNPSNGEFAINFSDYAFNNASLTISNMVGAIVYSEQLSSVSNSTKNFNLDLNSGVYVVRVADSKNEMTTRVVIK
jgi:hypothetical protein